MISAAFGTWPSPHGENKFPRRFERKFQLCRLAFGKIGIHLQFHSRRCPIRRGWRIQIHPQFVAGLVINPVPVQGMALHARPDTAGEAAEHILVFVLNGPAYGNHVTGSAVIGVDGGQNMIKERPFLEIGVVGVGHERK